MGTKGIGDVYCEQMTFSGPEPRRFVDKSLTLRELYIIVAGENCYIGRRGNIKFLIHDNTFWYSLYHPVLHNVDLADLWFKPVSTSTVVTLIGTTKD